MAAGPANAAESESDVGSDSALYPHSQPRSTADEQREYTAPQALVRLLKLIRPEAALIALGTLGAMGASGAVLCIPNLAGKIIDGMSPDTKSDAAGRTDWYLILILCVGAALALASWIESFCFIYASSRFAARLRQQVFANVLRQEVAFFDAARTGELLSRLSADTNDVRVAATNSVASILRHGAQVLGGLALLLSISWRLTAGLLCVVPPVSVVAVLYMSKVMHALGSGESASVAATATIADESLSSIRTVKAFCREESEAARYARAVDESLTLGRRVAFGWAAYDAAISFAAAAATSALLWYGTALVRASTMTAGQLSAYFLYGVFTAVSLALAARAVTELLRGVGSAARVLLLLDREPRLAVEGRGEVPAAPAGRVAFERVSFRYPARPDVEVLSDVSLELEPSRVTALVGPSGGGKSTLVALLLRQYDPCAGRVVIDGHDARRLEPLFHHQHVGVVSQEPVLFAMSVEENIKYGTHRPVTFADVERAARLANAHDFIAGFPEGYDTLVGERGVQLSGGQKQRIAIARAVLMDPRILVLDEATSALDAESEAAVQGALARLMANRTVLVIAHRLSTVRSAHCIAVVSRGRLVERGRHEELVARPNGVYRRLIRRQLAGGPSATDAAPKRGPSPAVLAAPRFEPAAGLLAPPDASGPEEASSEGEEGEAEAEKAEAAAAKSPRRSPRG